MRLRDALICLDLNCEEIFDQKGASCGEGVFVCPACAGRSTAFLMKWLNRKGELDELNQEKEEGAQDVVIEPKEPTP